MNVFIVSVVLLICGLLGLVYWAHLPGDSDMAFVVNSPGVEATQGPSGSGLKLITYNIAYSRGLADDIVVGRKGEDDIKANLAKIAAFLKDSGADIAFLQEVDLASKRTYYINEAKFLAERAGFPSYACVTNWSKNYVPFPYWPPSKHFGRVKSGQCILSKFPIVANERIALPPRGDKPFFYIAFEFTRAIQVVDVLIGGDIYKFYNVHQEAFDIKNREEQAKVLADVVNGGSSERKIVAGDFNALPPDAAVKKNFPLRPGTKYWKEWEDVSGDRSLEIFISETPSLLKGPKGFTFPADAPNRQIDHVFISKGLKIEDGKVLTEAGVLSDHLPIYVELGK